MIVTLPNLHLPTLTHIETYEVPVSIYLSIRLCARFFPSLSLSLVSFFLSLHNIIERTYIPYLHVYAQTDGRTDG